MIVDPFKVEIAQKMEHRPVLTSEWKKPKCLQYHNPTILDYSGWKKQVHEPFAVSWLSLITCLELCCQLPLTRISESVIPSYLLFLARCELVSHFLISHPDANTHSSLFFLQPFSSPFLFRQVNDWQPVLHYCLRPPGVNQDALACPDDYICSYGVSGSDHLDLTCIHLWPHWIMMLVFDKVSLDLWSSVSHVG